MDEAARTCLTDALTARAGDDKRLPCAAAFAVARELGVPVDEVGRTCNQLGIKIVSCQLGCF